MGRLLCCGIDAEEPRRFRRFVEAANPADPDASLIFHPAELSAALAADDPEGWLCRCFCAKEAVFKALGNPFNFNQLEFLPDATAPDWRWHGPQGSLPIPSSWFHRVENGGDDRERWVSVVFYPPDMSF